MAVAGQWKSSRYFTLSSLPFRQWNAAAGSYCVICQDGNVGPELNLQYGSISVSIIAIK
jgi:hypothetical protein